MRVLALTRVGDPSAALFTAVIAADDERPYQMIVSGRQIDDPVGFAASATSRIGSPCTSGYAGDRGGWHAHLGELLRRSGPGEPARSNLDGAVTMDAAPVPADRREALLAATALGQVAMNGGLAPLPPPSPPPPAETLYDRWRREDEEGTKERHRRHHDYLALTSLGRDVLTTGPLGRKSLPATHGPFAPPPAR